MDVALLQRYAEQGYTRKEIATVMGLPFSTVSNSCTKHGIKTKRPDMTGKRPLKDSVRRTLELREKGMSYRDISKTLNIPLHRVASACQDHGSGGAIIEQRLTESQVADYISRSGYTYVSGYTSGKKPVTVRCGKCGGTFNRQFHIFRDVVNGTWKSSNECPLCKKEKQEKKKAQEEAGREEKQIREAQERAKRKAEQLSRKVSNELMARLAIHVCKNCGNEFCIELTGYNSRVYCSEACQKRCHDRIKRDKRVKRMKSREIDADITLEKLFKRDGGICYLCGNKCDWDDGRTVDGTFVAGDHYPSIDHVVPVAKGGTHTWNNIKLACRECNTRKGWR